MASSSSSEVNTRGNDNTAGISALLTNQTANRNIALGSFADVSLTSGNDNIYIGPTCRDTARDGSTCRIKSIFGRTAPAGSAVFTDVNHKLGTLTFSKRFTENIEPVGTASEALFAFKLVAFHYKKEIDPGGIPQFGGKTLQRRYNQVNAMLLNEFLKEHRAF